MWRCLRSILVNFCGSETREWSIYKFKIIRMLKLILPLIILIRFWREGSLVQIGIGIIRFLFGLSYFHNFYIRRLRIILGLDYLGYIIIYLSLWIIFLIFISRQKIKKSLNFYPNFVILNSLLLLFLIMTFSSLDYLFFYISFEISLIPTLILIVGWDYQPERI